MIYLYAMDTPRLSPNLEDYRGIIPAGRIDQLSAFPVQTRLLSLAAELLFQRAVHRHCREVPLPANRDRLPGGKPYLLGRPDFHFNLSHSGAWAVCAVAPCPVGVDIEHSRPVSAKLSKRFSPEEQKSLAGLSPADFDRRFFDLWVLNESFVKCTGEGLSRPFRSFHGEHPAPGFTTQLVEFPTTDYHLAVCTQCSEVLPVQLLIMPS